MATPETTTCSNCGTANRRERKFCAECGSPLGVVCPSCGTANEPGERFCGECGTAIAASTRTTPTAAVSVERRLVSVLFADLVGFTPLSEDRDAEEVRDLLSRYFELSADVIGRYGGVVEKFIGDAVMAVWGTPVAQEDDAERAVRAALDLVTAVSDFGREAGMPDVAARAAVLTGEAAVNLGAAGQGMVAGDLVNTASRMQGVAEPGTVLVGESTRRSSDSAIGYAEAGVYELKGKAEPIPLWRALRVTAGRAGGLKSEGLEPPFVGRDREVRLAKELFHATADERKSHLLSITGIAGIGKSRLGWELYKYLDGIAQEVAWHRGRCLAYGDGVTYWALAEMVRMRAGIAEGEEPVSAAAKLRTTLEEVVDDADERAWLEPRLGQLLSLETRQELEQADLFGGWRLFFERLADRDPVVLAFEDVQWADSGLLDFVEYLLDWSRNHPILVVALARPELVDRHPHWAASLRNATTLALEPLSDEAMEALLDGFVPGLPGDLRAQILTRAEGVPLYAVETVRMLLDRGLLEQAGDEYRPVGAIEELEVPETLHALIASRLDGLAPDERRGVQQAAVLGKTFTRDGLAAVSGLAEDELDRLLLGLVRKEILSLHADPRSPERGQYGFLQDLLRQVAYESLSRRERRVLHLAAADSLESGPADAELDVAEIVAAHYLSALALEPEADDAAAIKAKAESTLERAADRATALGASDQAQHYVEQAIELTESPLRRAELHERAGQMAARNVPPAGARSHFETATLAFDELGLTHPSARVRARLGLLIWQEEHDIEQAISELETAFGVLEGDEPDADLAMLAVTLGRPLFFTGRHDDALERTEFALAIAESLQLPEVLSHGLNTKGLILSARGRHEEAELLVRHALDVALKHDLSEAALRAFGNLVAMVATRDRLREALELAVRGRELARRVGNRELEGNLRAHLLGVLTVLGEWDDVLQEEETLEAADEESRWTRMAFAFIYVQRGEREEVRRRLDAIQAILDEKEAQNVVGFRSLEAELLLAEGAAQQALAVAEQAIAVRGDLAGGLAMVAGGLVVALRAAFELNDEAKVDELLGLVESLPPGDLTPFLRATGARFGARRAARRGERATADIGFRAAEGILREIGMTFDLASVLLEHAEWLAADGRSEEAVPLAVEAREIFERLRATPWIERTDRLPAAVAVGQA